MLKTNKEYGQAYLDLFKVLDKMTITICPKLFTFWEKIIWTWRIWTGYKKDLDILAKVKVDRK